MLKKLADALSLDDSEEGLQKETSGRAESIHSKSSGENHQVVRKQDLLLLEITYLLQTSKFLKNFISPSPLVSNALSRISQKKKKKKSEITQF